MISPHFAQTMARYNQWQNRSLYAEADGLSDAERRLDRGAFFKSIHGTLNHILWADAVWMSRVSQAARPDVAISESGRFLDAWDALKREREEMDERLIAWANGLDEVWLAQDLRWIPATRPTEMARPRWQVVAHMFNHQTHHRGQAHAMLTAAGARPEPTDLVLLETGAALSS